MKNDEEQRRIAKSEHTANHYTAKCLVTMTLIVCFALLLNILDIFIIEDYLMYIATGGCVICAIAAVLVVHFFNNRLSTKYILFALMAVFIAIVGVTVTYHTVLISAMPIMCAVQYKKNRVVYYTYILSVISIFIGVMGGYYFGLCDANMLALTDTVATKYIDPETGYLLFKEPNPNPWGTLPIFYVLPRALVLFAFVPVMKRVTSVISDNAVREAELKILSEMDTMTQLYNRNKYDKMLKETYSAIEKVGVIFWDLNDLKTINDEMGHEYGDFVISSLAGAIKENIGRGTRAFRVGGDEIVVIQKNANEASVQELIERIYESIEYKNKMSKVKISVASGYCIGAGKEIEKVIAEADARMYVEKKRIKEEQKRIKLINVTNGAEELK